MPRKLKNLKARQKKSLKPREQPYQYDGCGCYWVKRFYPSGVRRMRVKCELHRRKPHAFGGLLIGRDPGLLVRE